jgi:CRP/FNR family cyclic AMP-dependent transcriptional regulator
MDGLPDFSDLFDKEKKILFKAGEVLFNEGDKADGLYVLISGRLQIAVGDVIVEYLESGGLVGEMALIDNEPRSATVKALSDSHIVKISQDQFLQMVRQIPQFALKVMLILTHRLRTTNQKLHA